MFIFIFCKELYPSQLIFFFLSVLFHCLLVCKFSAEKSSENLLRIPCNKLFFSYPFKILLLSLFLITVSPMWVSLSSFFLDFIELIMFVYIFMLFIKFAKCLAIIYSNKPVFLSLLFLELQWFIYWSTWPRPISSLSLFTFLHFFFPFLPLRFDNFKFLYVW